MTRLSINEILRTWSFGVGVIPGLYGWKSRTVRDVKFEEGGSGGVPRQRHHRHRFGDYKEITTPTHGDGHAFHVFWPFKRLIHGFPGSWRTLSLNDSHEPSNSSFAQVRHNSLGFWKIDWRKKSGGGGSNFIFFFFWLCVVSWFEVIGKNEALYLSSPRDHERVPEKLTKTITPMYDVIELQLLNLVAQLWWPGLDQVQHTWKLLIILNLGGCDVRETDYSHVRLRFSCSNIVSALIAQIRLKKMFWPSLWRWFPS